MVIKMECARVSELPATPEQKTPVGNWKRKVDVVDIPTKWLPQEFDRGL